MTKVSHLMLLFFGVSAIALLTACSEAEVNRIFPTTPAQQGGFNPVPPTDTEQTPEETPVRIEIASTPQPSPQTAPPPQTAQTPPGGVKQQTTWNFYGGFGPTFFINNNMISYKGTGVGNGASTTDNSVNVMPTFQAYAKYTPPDWHGAYIGIDLNVRTPFSGYQSNSFTTSNGFTGTTQVKNGLGADLMGRFGVPNAMLGYGEFLPG